MIFVEIEKIVKGDILQIRKLFKKIINFIQFLKIVI